MKKKKKPTDEQSQQGISRRGFLKGVGVGSGVLSAGILGPLLPEAEALPQAPSVKVLGPSAVPIELTVNGRQRSLKLEPRVTLLEALREGLDLTGAKRVCDRANCGACTVILEGRAVYSCTVLAIEAQGKKIETVEGLAPGDQLHPVQAAFVEHDAQQCGFCTPGFVMAAKAFLDNHPNPTPEQIRLGLGGNLCRCGTYAGVRKAVMEAAEARLDRIRTGPGGGPNA